MYGCNKGKCRFCNCEDEFQRFGNDLNNIFHVCSNCGLYFINECLAIDGMFYEKNIPDESELLSKYASFFYYNKLNLNDWREKHKGIYIGTQRDCQQFQRIHNYTEYDMKIIDDAVIDLFCSKTLVDQENLLLTDIFNRRDKKSNHAIYSYDEICSATFTIRYPMNSSFYSQYIRPLSDLQDDGYIKIIDDGKTTNSIVMEITTKGIKKVQEGEKSMPNTISGNFTNNGIMVVGSNVTNSTIENGNSSSNFDYEGLKEVLTKLQNFVASEELNNKEIISADVEEAMEYVDAKDNKHLLNRLNSIAMFIQTCGAVPAIIQLGEMIKPYISQLLG